MKIYVPVTQKLLQKNKMKGISYIQYLNDTEMDHKEKTQRQLELQKKLSEFDICICVETWLTEKENIQFSGFITFRRDRQQGRGGGIIVLLRKNLVFKNIENILCPDESVEMCGIQINNIIPTLDILICYRAPGLVLKQDQWDVIVNNINKNNHSILLGDFNAHNTSWNCDYTDANVLNLTTL